MKKSTIKVLTICTSLALLFFNSCNSDDDIVIDPDTGSGGGGTTPPITSEVFSQEEEDALVESVITSNSILTNLVVRVENTNDLLLSGTEVEVGGQTGVTDENGQVIFENITLNEDYAFITAEKEGYEKAMRTETPSKNGITNVILTLLEDTPALTLDSANGGILEKDNVVLNFPSEAVIDESGELFEGEVLVDIIYYSPEDPNFGDTQPGVLVGIDEENEEVSLISEGMLTVNLTDASGNPLNIGNGKTTSITMPASADGPESILLWHFNETYGLWVETGEAVKNGNIYEFEVTHFSSYNLDYKGEDAFEFCVNIKTADGVAISNEEINIVYSSIRTYTTDNLGQLCFRNASPNTYSFSHLNNCIGSEQSEPTDVIIDSEGNYDVLINVVESVTPFNISGSLVDCNNMSLPNKFFTINIEGRSILGFTDDAGNYSIDELLCGDLLGVNSATLRVVEDNGAIENTFLINLENTETVVDLSSCGEIVSFNDDDVILVNRCLFDYSRFYDVSGDEIPQISYGEIKAITRLGRDSCFDEFICEDPEFMQSLPLLVNLESILIDVPTLQLPINFEDFSNLGKLENITIVYDSEDEMQMLDAEVLVQELEEALPNIEVDTIGSFCNFQ